MNASVDTVVISREDLDEGVAAIRDFHCLEGWVKANKPECDIEMQARNVCNPIGAGAGRNQPEYKQMLRKMQDKYNIGEQDLALQLLRHMRAAR